MKSISDFQATITSNLDKTPSAAPDSFVAPGVFMAGDVRLGPLTSVWPGSSLRGDINYIAIGEGSNVQDGSVVHVDDERPALIGKFVTIGHRAVVHACHIEDECLIGMGAIILDGATVGRRSIVGAGAVVTKGAQIPPGSLVLGCPAKVVRPLTPEEQESLRHWAERYVALSREYLARNKA